MSLWQGIWTLLSLFHQQYKKNSSGLFKYFFEPGTHCLCALSTKICVKRCKKKLLGNDSLELRDLFHCLTDKRFPVSHLPPSPPHSTPPSPPPPPPPPHRSLSPPLGRRPLFFLTTKWAAHAFVEYFSPIVIMLPHVLIRIRIRTCPFGSDPGPNFIDKLWVEQKSSINICLHKFCYCTCVYSVYYMQIIVLEAGST